MDIQNGFVGMSRMGQKQTENKEIALKFGEGYFDGKREHGYGGYHYDGRWLEVGKRLIERHKLKPGSKFWMWAVQLLMHDLVLYCQRLMFRASTYQLMPKKAYGSSMIKSIWGIVSLPFENNSFDASVAINTLHNLDENDQTGHKGVDAGYTKRV